MCTHSRAPRTQAVRPVPADVDAAVRGVPAGAQAPLLGEQLQDSSVHRRSQVGARASIAAEIGKGRRFVASVAQRRVQFGFPYRCDPAGCGVAFRAFACALHHHRSCQCDGGAVPGLSEPRWCGGALRVMVALCMPRLEGACARVRDGRGRAPQWSMCSVMVHGSQVQWHCRGCGRNDPYLEAPDAATPACELLVPSD